MKQIRVGDRAIGRGAPAFIIAEAGVNYENDLERAREMVRVAAQAGADAIKFQTFVPERLVAPIAPKFWDVEGCPGETQLEEFKTLPQLTVEQYAELKKVADECGIVFFSTPCDEQSADMLDSLGVPLFKIASMDITHFPLLKHIARKGKPIILSTGASTIAEIAEAVSVIRSQGNNDIVLLHCTSNYPTDFANANLRMMVSLQHIFPDCPVGYSDHTLSDPSLTVPTVAVALGAAAIEKHFTFDKNRSGYDHCLSMDYEDLRRLVNNLRIVQDCLGLPLKSPLPSEERARLYGRRSLVAEVDIPAGTVIEPAMVAIKRPATGIEPRFLDAVLGRVARGHIKKGEVITWEKV
jgi:sialic acid synthase SpsE